ncbi:hypothetical protein JTE90_005418 [Oedothorax gibbosus]|uniref:Uncharacterized protein n=1 Tax=Oedothorax gibbosus TaxID=931172 RepID=A0AAV6UR49_9ARAC|nr:hypothetical protein JTE90_005418 [Oedothorax gibbosus]
MERVGAVRNGPGHSWLGEDQTIMAPLALNHWVTNKNKNEHIHRGVKTGRDNRGRMRIITHPLLITLVNGSAPRFCRSTTLLR